LRPVHCRLDGGLTTYSYDAANRIAWLLNPFGERTTFAYDAAGRSIRQENANGTVASYTYDDAARLTLLANLKSDGTTLSSFLHLVDAMGNRSGVTEANGDIVTWSYDNAYQLTRERRSGANAYDIIYTYDPVGNRLTKLEGGVTTTYTYDAANQITTEQTPTQMTTFTFDDNGSTVVENAAGALTTYTWDIENMCTGIALPNGTLNTFLHDADLKHRQAEDSAGLVRFINDLENVLLETDSGGTTQVAYTLEPALYGNLVSQRRGVATSWHLFDALGSTERLTDSAQAAQVQYLAKAFGFVTIISGSSPNRYTWFGRLGYRWEPDPSEYDVRLRRIDPACGRWNGPDPAIQEPNKYVYCANSPLALTDPSGESWTGPPRSKRPPGTPDWSCVGLDYLQQAEHVKGPPTGSTPMERCARDTYYLYQDCRNAKAAYCTEYANQDRPPGMPAPAEPPFVLPPGPTIPMPPFPQMPPEQVRWYCLNSAWLPTPEGIKMGVAPGQKGSDSLHWDCCGTWVEATKDCCAGGPLPHPHWPTYPMGPSLPWIPRRRPRPPGPPLFPLFPRPPRWPPLWPWPPRLPKWPPELPIPRLPRWPRWPRIPWVRVLL
jgi:RHS repeat-associated protein